MNPTATHSPVRRALSHLAVLGVVGLAFVFGLLDFIECKIADLRFELLRRDVSGDLVLVEIDARSLRALDGWPWPRSYHAQITDILSEAGADRIGFDIDFSSHSSRPGDAALAEAFAGADGRVVLPVFEQMMRRSGGGEHLVVSRPLPEFERSAELGSVNVMAGADGLVRRMSSMQSHGLERVPSFFAVLAGYDHAEPGPFFIDYGIQAGLLARLSYVDVLLGRFDPNAVAGKQVLIGSTAMELGDQVAVPIYGSLPGPVLQALAYESIAQGRAIRTVPRWLTLGVMALLAGLAGWGFTRWSWRLGLAVLSGGGVVLFLVSVAVQAAAPVAIYLTPWLLVPILGYAVAMIGRVDQLDLRLLAQTIALRKSGAFMRQVIDNSFDGIVTIDGDGQIKSLNKAAEAVLGSEAETVLGSSFYRLVASGTWQGLVPEGELYAKPQEIRRTRPDGTCSAVQVAISRTEVEDELVHIAILRDITKQKRAEKTAEQAQFRLHEAIERIHEGFALYDPEGNLALSNGKFRELAERIPGPTDRVEIPKAEPGENIADGADGADGMGEDGTGHYREIVLEDGTWLRASLQPTQEGGAVAVYADISELKQRESELQVAVRQAEAANRSKTEFLANMSHELRTPLNAIIGFSETMVTEMLGPVGTPQYKEYAGDILASGRHLLDIITDILDVSKIEAGELRLTSEWLEAEAVTDDALRMIRERAASSGHRITSDIPDSLPTLFADRRAVLQVLLNLLSNALKFTGDGGEIVVGLASHADGTLTIAIKDSGIGMAAEDIPRALSLFGQVEDTMQRCYEGTGLGLPLSDRLMTLHGGSMEIDSTIGIGTTVTLRFPADRVDWPVADSESATA